MKSRREAIRLFICLPAVSALLAIAEENLPGKPFAQMVWLPEPKEWVVTPWYEYTEFQNIWRGAQKENITVGDGHGFDQNNGIVMVEWGFQKD